MGKEFGKKLKMFREKGGLTQIDLANEFKVSRSTIGFWENGRQEPNMETLELIADFFKTDINYLLGYPSDKETAFKQGLQALNLEQYKALSNDDKQLLAEQFNALIDRLEKK